MKIMINGRSLSGKDEVANYLVDTFDFRQVSFAKPIYDIARDYFGRDMACGRSEGDRELLIDIGQHMREIKPSIWIDNVLKTINESDHPHWVVSDVRQSNEYVICKAAGFIPIRVSSSLENRIKRCENRDGFTPTDETIELWESEGEIGADEYEYHEIYNNGTLEELYEQVDDIVNMYRCKEGIK